MLLACVLLSAACDDPIQPEGECRGTYRGQSVAWPIVLNSVMGRIYLLDGTDSMEVHLAYTPEGV
ncbi:hypothetical protein D7V97_40975 [Corallococcus sp. CA053C]|nr:hypothetical protein D7V97_40975 [Corallococcus sp. CA053C]